MYYKKTFVIAKKENEKTKWLNSSGNISIDQKEGKNEVQEIISI